MLVGLLATPWRLPPLASIQLCATLPPSCEPLPPCCEPDGPLCPADAPQATVAISEAGSLRLRVPDDDAVMEDYIGQAHQVALAADDYDTAMLAHCEQAITEDPAYWAQLWPSAVAMSRWLQEQPELVAGLGVHVRQVHGEVHRKADHCPGKKPPFLTVKRPARPYKNPVQNGFS